MARYAIAFGAITLYTTAGFVALETFAPKAFQAFVFSVTVFMQSLI